MLKAALRVLDFRESLARRRLNALSTKQAERRAAVCEIEQIRRRQECEIREAGSQVHATATAQHIREAHLGYRKLETAMRQTETLESMLQLELRRVEAHKQEQARRLAGIRFKAEFLHGKESTRRRQLRRRQEIRELVGSG